MWLKQSRHLSCNSKMENIFVLKYTEFDPYFRNIFSLISTTLELIASVLTRALIQCTPAH